MVRKLSITLLLSVLPCIAFASEENLQKQIDAQQRAMLNMQNEIIRLNGEIAQLRGQIEVIENNQAKAISSNSTSTNTIVPVVTSSSVNNSSNISSTTNTTSISTTSTVVDNTTDEAKTEYNSAYQYITQNNFEMATVAFSNYLKKYPDNSLTPNAWYWLGQVQFNQTKLDEARVSFLNVAKYTNSQKRPDALYKLGLISRLNGDEEKAVKYFNLVMQNYPNDAAAVLAQRELNR